MIDPTLDLHSIVRKRPLINIVYVEANIGGGKSTLLRQVERLYPDIITLQEPVDVWLNTFFDVPEDGKTKRYNILDLYYKDPKKYGAIFQHIALITRINRLFKAIQDAEPGTIILCERSPFSDSNCFAKMNFESGNIDHVSYSTYQSYFDYFTKTITCAIPDVIVYLQTDPSVAYQRLQIRKRTEESTVPLEYLSELHRYHEQWLTPVNFSDPNDTQLTTVNANVDFLNDIEPVKQLMRIVKSLLNRK